MKHWITWVLISSTMVSLQAQQQNPAEIQVSGMGQVRVFPDAAEITLHIYHVKPTLKEAVQLCQETSQQVMNVLQSYTEQQSIKNSFITTGKSTRWDHKKNTDVFAGFEAQRKIVFTLNRLEAMQALTEALLKTKFYRIERIFYFHTQASQYIVQAQELAVKDAQATAQRMAQSAGLHLSHCSLISTQDSPNSGRKRGIRAGEFATYSKGMGGEGVSSSGELITFESEVELKAIAYP